MIRRTTTVALVAILALAAAGCASDEQPAATGTTTVATSRTVTQTVTRRERAQKPKPPARPRNGLRFRGNGDTRLPPFRIGRRGATLRWTNRGEVFSLFGRGGTIVDSVAHGGQAFLPAGVHRIDVVASGSWVIAIPHARRVR
ncbi:MAG: hypothetical protein M3312_02530 [Actinomycetota bacterium]|nr:hypothetical protein [Actinomycetota bacterium]